MATEKFNPEGPGCDCTDCDEFSCTDCKECDAWYDEMWARHDSEFAPCAECHQLGCICDFQKEYEAEL